MMKYLRVLIASCSLVVVGCQTPNSSTSRPQIPTQGIPSQTTPLPNSGDNLNTGADSATQKPKFTTDMSHPILPHLNLPEGFAIQEFAKVAGARSLTWAEDESKYVIFVGTKDKGNVYALVDEGKDYTIDRAITLATKLNMPNGVAYKDGTLYIAEVDRILKASNILNTLDKPIFTTVLNNLPKDEAHGWKYIAFGPDGMLYVPIGAPCNICNPDSPYASLWRYDTQTRQRTLVAQGIRNTVGFTRQPESDNLWFTDNGRDRLGDNNPPDELNQVIKEGEHFGFPFCHGGTIVDGTFDTRKCSEFKTPFINLGPHVAALGMKFYTGKMFPNQYKGNVFIAEHGSRNRTVATGYRVTIVDTKEKTYTPFIDGRIYKGKTIGRPVDILQLPDGSMLISDDFAGLIYRVVYNP